MNISPTWLWKNCGGGLMLLVILGVSGLAWAAEEPEPLSEPSTNSFVEESVPAVVSSLPLTNLVTQVEQTNVPPPLPTVSAEQAWKSFMQLQGQMDTALLAIERSRREREIVEEQNQRQLEQRLKMIEQSIDDQRDQETQAMREANHNMLLVAGIFAGIGFLAMVITSIFHFRAMNKLGSIFAAFPMDSRFVLGSGATAALAAHEERLLGAQSGRAGKEKPLLSAIDRLEQRIHELESTSQSASNSDLEPGSHAQGNGQSKSSRSESASQGASEDKDLETKISMILGKGQALLNMGQAAEAVATFDDALAVQPGNAEAWIKKGAAMEKLNRLPEAIECYDQAISSNDGMTLAYLYKGGVFNRMERYNEALACYEKALKTQQAPTSAPVAEAAE